jgi:type IV secretory pathway VirB2 component (pilin)
MNGASLAEASGDDSLVAALTWVQGTLLGTVATAVGVVAIATIGLMMLAGRIDLWRGVRTVLGLFILFGASTIADGLMAGARGVADAPSPIAGPHPGQPPAAPPAASAYDPYAGVSPLPSGPQWSDAEPSSGSGGAPRSKPGDK